MIRYVLLLILVPAISFGQNWAPFHPQESATYAVEKGFQIDSINYSFAKNEVFLQKITWDSLAGPAHYYRNYFMIGCSSMDINCPDFFESTCTDSFSWNGQIIINDQSGWYSVNQFRDTILLPSSNISKDTFFVSGNKAFIFNRSAQSEMEIYNSIDSIVEYEIQVYENGQIDIEHPWNGTVIILSKSYGWLKCPVWNFFPREKSIVKQIGYGTNDPFGGFKNYKIYNYEIGDSLHFLLTRHNGVIKPPAFEYRDSVIVEYQKCRVTGRFVDTTSGGIVSPMQCEVRKEVKFYEELYNVQNYTHSTFSEYEYNVTWDNSSDPQGFNIIPKRTIGAQLVDGLPIIEYHYRSRTESSTAECPIYTTDIDSTYYSRMIIVPGLGLVESTHRSVRQFPNKYQFRSIKLIYYSSTDTVYGAPMWPLSVKTINAENQLTIYPNPAQNVITIEGLENNKVDVAIYDQLGRLAMSRVLGNQESRVDISNLPRGLYFLQVGDSQKKYKLIKQ